MSRHTRSPSASTSVSRERPRRRPSSPSHSRSRSKSPAESSTVSTLDSEKVFLTFLESKFNELARRQEELLHFQHELELREKSLELQSQQMTWLDGYHRGMMKNRGGGGRGGFRGRNRGRGSRRPVDASILVVEDGQIPEH